MAEFLIFICKLNTKTIQQVDDLLPIYHDPYVDILKYHDLQVDKLIINYKEWNVGDF